MNYSASFKSLKTEIASTIQYKHIGSPRDILACIATAPFWIVMAALICSYYVVLFIYNGIASSADYLEAWLKDAKKDIHHATEAVLYFVCMPFIFFARCVLSVFGLFFYMIWFMTMCSAYIATLGGVRWQPFIASARYDGETKLIATTAPSAALVFSVIGALLFVIALLTNVLAKSGEFWELYETGVTLSWLYFVFTIISVPAIFKKEIRSIDEDAEEASSEEDQAN